MRENRRKKVLSKAAESYNIHYITAFRSERRIFMNIPENVLNMLTDEQ